MSTCTFVQAWLGACGQPSMNLLQDRCSNHHELLCCNCGERATHSCDETMGPLVCGYSLCDQCTHEFDSNGTNCAANHCRKDDQVYTPWYSRDNFGDNSIPAVGFVVIDKRNGRKPSWMSRHWLFELGLLCEAQVHLMGSDFKLVLIYPGQMVRPEIQTSWTLFQHCQVPDGLVG